MFTNEKNINKYIISIINEKDQILNKDLYQFFKSEFDSLLMVKYGSNKKKLLIICADDCKRDVLTHDDIHMITCVLT